MARLAFWIPGKPVGKGRPRAHARIIWVTPEGGGPDEPKAVVSMHTPADTAEAEKQIRRLFAAKFPGHRPWTGAVMLRFTAVFETPASFTNALKAAAREAKLFCTAKPDKDNIEKLIVDALNGLAWVDDAQVQGGGVKRYGSPARIEVDLQSLDSPDVPATPGQKRAEARVDAGGDLRPRRPLRDSQTKSERPDPDLSAYSPLARARISAALARDAGRRR